MIELVVADAMKPHRRAGRHHEIQRRTQRPPIRKGRRQTAWRDRLPGNEAYPHEAAGGVGLELQKIANFIWAQLIGSCCGFRLGLRLSWLRWRQDGGARECRSLEKAAASEDRRFGFVHETAPRSNLRHRRLRRKFHLAQRLAPGATG